MTTFLATVILLAVPTNVDEPDTKNTPEDAIATMSAAISKGDFKALYNLRCHKHLRDQVDENGFVKTMQGKRGKIIIDLFVAVDIAIKQNEGPEVLIARPGKDADEYEFILVKAQKRSPGPLRGWHLELKKEDGVWKLMDTD